MDDPEIVTPAPNGDATPPLPRGFPPIVLRPPTLKRGAEPYLAAEIAAPLEADHTLAMKVASAAVDSCRENWSAICSLHVETMSKTSQLLPEIGQQLKSRAIAFERQQTALRRCDAALGEVRVALQETETAIRRKTVPARQAGDLAGAVLAGEVRSWLRSLPQHERVGAVERAIGAGDAKVVAACLELPVVAGLDETRAALLLSRWQQKMAPDELSRLEQLTKAAERVSAAGEALQRRVAEAFNHAELDAIEASSKAAAAA